MDVRLYSCTKDLMFSKVCYRSHKGDLGSDIVEYLCRNYKGLGAPGLLILTLM
jgi:hypothetical protein